MTRINVGIQPKELCDQHLLAEYREILRPINHPPKARPPEQFKLGKGHVVWCAQFPSSLMERQHALIDEMRHRGFQTNIPPIDIDLHLLAAARLNGWDYDDALRRLKSGDKVVKEQRQFFKIYVPLRFYWRRHDEVQARPIVQRRIRTRLMQMSGTPTWTKREAPSWAIATAQNG